MSKIIILDGTYGVGKTTVAHSICEISNGEYICIDPDEYYNSNLEDYFLFGWPVQSNKAILSKIRKEIEEKKLNNNIVIPLTINSSKYRQMWIGSFQDLAELYHIVLMAEKKQIINHINSDVHRDMSFAMESLDDNLRYYQGEIEGSIKIETTNVIPQMIANKILEIV